MSLRTTAALGLAVLLLLLLGTGGMGLWLLVRTSGTVQRVLRENHDSVAYGQAMKDAIDELDAASSTAAADAAITRFTAALRQEEANVTLPGEHEAVALLHGAWDRHLAAVNARLPLTGPTPSTATAVKAAAQRIIDLNLASILSADGAIRQEAARSTRLMLALLIGGALLAALCAALALRALLGPLRALTRSAQEIGRGNLDLVVQAPGDDELGRLAEAFNTMAGHLREARRLDRHSLVRAQRTTQLALDSLPDAVATVTADGVVDLANHTAQRLFHLRPGMALDAPSDSATVAALQALAACWRQVMERGQAVEPAGYAGALQAFDCGERFFLPHGLPIRDAAGQTAGVTLVLADITALRHLDELKSNLVAVVAHELRTPLTGLRMATHLLLDEKLGTLGAKQLDLALAARDDAERLHTIVEGLLDLSRLESGRTLLDLRAVAPRTLADDAIGAVRTAYRDHGVTLDCAVPARLPTVLADAVRIAHVFANLLGNALKYTPRGGQVTVAATAGDGAVEFTVSDTGAGIPAEHRARIFERFYRVPDQQVAGAGLGLAIAREIITAHGGRLTLDAGDGPGSTFRFTVPCAADTEQRTAEPEPRIAE